MWRFFLSVLCLLGFSFSSRAQQNLSLLCEMRGLWVASVANIDWPSAPGLDDAQLKMEADAILDRALNLNLNTIFLQVRPASDAIYFSNIEPMSYYVVGSDLASRPSFDPLKYWIDGAHERGIELHAWFNPFRVSTSADFLCGEGHVSKTHPEWTISYDNKLQLDPGLPEARKYVTDVVMDVVNRYDVDGIHFDDYFYPYPVKDKVFDDASSYEMFNSSSLAKSDWRRQNVSLVIKAVADSIAAVKPWVQFGISPFGVWRNKNQDPKGSNTRAGVTDYDTLYADILDWIARGYLDYVIPQVYWEGGNKWADFYELERWWADYASAKTKIFIGHAVFKINTGKSPNVGWNRKAEMPDQVTSVRSNPKLGGSVFFSYRQFNRNILDFEDFLTSKFYKNRALQAPLAASSPESLSVVNMEKNGRKLSWQVQGDSSLVRFYVVFRELRSNADKLGSNDNIFCITDKPELEVPLNVGPRQRYVYRVSVVDKFRRVHPLSRRITVRE